MPRQKPRGEADWFGVPIEDDLEDGESTAGTPTVRILQYGAGTDPTDVTDQFQEASQTDLRPAYANVTTKEGVTKAGIRFHLCAAKAAGEQRIGLDYRVEAKFDTDTGRDPVATDAAGNLPRLRVT